MARPTKHPKPKVITIRLTEYEWRFLDVRCSILSLHFGRRRKVTPSVYMRTLLEREMSKFDLWRTRSNYLKSSVGGAKVDYAECLHDWGDVMADEMHNHAYRWSDKMPECCADIVVSWQTPDGGRGMTWCSVSADGSVRPKSEIPHDALLFGWVYDR